MARAIGTALDVAGLLTALAPWRTALLFRASRWLGPAWGPVVTHVSLAAPVAGAAGFISALTASSILSGSSALSAPSVLSGSSALSGYVWMGVGVAVSAVAASSHRLSIPAWAGGCRTLLLAAALAALGSAAVKLLSRRRRAGAALAAVAVACALTLRADPRCAGGLTAANNAGAAFRMLSREESATGWVTVSDDAARGLRVLRSGHSIIGGHWSDTRESIFGIFYYADAVRLAHGAQTKAQAQAAAGRGGERALVIGLGVGVAARSLHEQGVRVDVVELDAAVHRAAAAHFGLPRALHGVFVQDGRAFVDAAPSGAYDYVVHDVFTGGSVPAALFSQAAVAQLARVLAPRGVLAMNYVGVLGDTRTLHHVARTLREAFAHVRCFAESAADPAAVTNMMFFASQEPIRFAPQALRRAADPASIRGHVLAAMEANEVSLAYDARAVRPITDAWNPLPAWLAPAARLHWLAMREMFPDEYWLNY
ncbi:hypothetical protein IWW47_003267 [Coemansia sp. RSA 2052]|nr:hypothetical protein IWW47_003267 [Coemansia sp. RSA 2052]